MKVTQAPNIRLVATDLDGTLVHSTGIVTPANRAMLHALREAGVHVAVCTGRRHSYAMRVLREAVLQPDEIVISSNGAVTRTTTGDLLWRSTLEPSLVRRLCAALADYRDALVLTFDRSGPAGADAPGALALEQMDTLHGSIRRWMEQNAASIRRYERIENALDENEEGPIQAMLCGRMDRMARADTLLQQDFAAELATYRTEYPGKDLCILDIVPRDVSKGTALRQLAKRLGVSLADTLVLGDNWNDLPMLQVAGHAAVLANSPGDLLTLARQHGWFIAHDGDADGFASAVAAIVGLPVPALA